MPRTPIHELPPGYREVEYLILLDSNTAVRLNLLALILLFLDVASIVLLLGLLEYLRRRWRA